MTSHNLPSQSTPFVGRETELAEIADLLFTPECRLLTIIGSGGVGKTRLAIEAAKRTSFPNGAYFVPLQPLTSTDFILPTFADALHFSFHRDQDPKAQLLDFLREKHILLVLDNFEHLLDGTDLLSEILENASGVKLLVTSRERLHLREEWVFEVSGLAFPKNGHMIALDDYSAAQLFMQSARQAGYMPQTLDTMAITRICQMVEGIPLAIELSAVWVRVMPCAEIAREIERSLDILTTTVRNVPEKHRSMRAVFEHSWQLMSAHEQAVFRKLAVFRGGFRREAAEQVTGASLAILASLVDKSLLRADANGRYSLQELLRQYADDQLEQSGEAQAARDAHCAYYAAFLHRLLSDLKGPKQVRALDDVETDLDNVRVSWRWAVTHGKAHEIGQSIDALARFYYMRSRQLEGIEAFEIDVKRFGAVENELHAQLLLLLSWFSGTEGYPLEKQIDYIQQGLTILRQRGICTTLVLPMVNVRPFVDELGGYETIQPIYEAHLAAFTKKGDEWERAWVLFLMGDLATTLKRYEEAQPLLQESLASFQALGDGWASGWSTGTLAHAAKALQHYEEAQDYLSANLELNKEARDRAGTLWVIIEWAMMSLEWGKTETSARLVAEALNLLLDFAWDDSMITITLVWTAHHLMVAEGPTEQLIELLTFLQRYSGLSQIQRCCNTFGIDLSSFFHRLDGLKAELAPNLVAAAIQRGETSNLKALVAALQEQFSVQEKLTEDAENQPSLRGQQLIDDLSEREMEILQLIADGLTSRQIAQRIFLSLGTIHWYLKQIYSKLNVHSRTQAVARARELKLLA